LPVILQIAGCEIYEKEHEVKSMMEAAQQYFHEVQPVCPSKGEDKRHPESQYMEYDVLSDNEDAELSECPGLG
jgi:hypothetical protein